MVKPSVHKFLSFDFSSPPLCIHLVGGLMATHAPMTIRNRKNMEAMARIICPMVPYVA